jgi:hypothetical protein
MNEERKKIIDRIRKMLAMAEDNANENEAATAAGMAARLIAKHQITNVEIQAGRVDDSMTVDREDWVIPGVNLPAWCGSLSIHVGRFMSCSVYRLNCAGVKFYGCEGDAEIAKEMMVYPQAAVNRLAKQYLAQHGGGRTAGNTFRVHAVRAIGERLQEMKAAEEAAAARDEQANGAGSEGRALVLLDQSKERALAKAGVPFKVRRGSSRSRYNRHAADAGREAGRRVSLNTQIRGGSMSRELLS